MSHHGGKTNVRSFLSSGSSLFLDLGDVFIWVKESRLGIGMWTCRASTASSCVKHHSNIVSPCSLQWEGRYGSVDVELFFVSRCHGYVATPPWWRWLRKREFYVERSKLVSGQIRICASRTVCPSCPAGRGSSHRHTRPRPLPLAMLPPCSGTPPSERQILAPWNTQTVLCKTEKHSNDDHDEVPPWMLECDERCFSFLVSRARAELLKVIWLNFLLPFWASYSFTWIQVKLNLIVMKEQTFFSYIQKLTGGPAPPRGMFVI